MQNTKQLQTITARRSSGILMHISSLPGEYGIGDLGSGSYNFIDFLAAAGQRYWQILPLGPVSAVFGNSPYMSYAAFAGNPLLISPELLLKEQHIQPSNLPGSDFSPYNVAFSRVKAWKKKVLTSAWHAFQANAAPGNLEQTCTELPWIRDYGLFMALKHKFNQKSWLQWPIDLRRRNPTALRRATTELEQEINYFCFEQYLFYSQWRKLRSYAAKKGILLIGDLPIYVGLDSVDVWSDQEIFELSAAGNPIHVAGVPPDYFSKNGQRWGNPLYRWNTKKVAVKQQLYDWWARRLEAIFATVDVIRIDHFRGFESYWAVPAKEKTAVNGAWKKGPGIQFFRDMEKRLGSLPIIAEDLGIITPEVEQLRDDLNYPGMKILLFAFDGHPDNPYLPQNYTQNCVVYSGTHDNDTAVGWYLSDDVSPESRKLAKLYANCHDDDASTFHRQLIYLAQSSTAGLSILPMQDVLGFGNDCRMNTPSTSRGNWQWRCAPEFFTDELAESLRRSTVMFGRLSSATAKKTTNEHPYFPGQPEKKRQQ